MILVIGSHALNHQLGNIRTPSDLDLVCHWEDLPLLQTHDLRVVPKTYNHLVGWLNEQRVEIHLADPDSTDYQLLTVHEQDRQHTLEGLPVTYCRTNWLYSLKMSHRYKRNSVHFLKTMKDIKLLRRVGASVPDRTWWKARVKETLARHPKLNQDKDNFFNTEGIVYVYDHDSIHQAMALGPRPAYLEYLADDREVWCDVHKWNALDHQTRLAGVVEEALVLALERSQIPHDFVPDQHWSFATALHKVCTSITSGWFRNWAWEHYDEALDLYNNLPWDYVQRFKNQLATGVVKELP